MNPGEVWWVNLGTGTGREQSGVRPAMVISSSDYADIVNSLSIVLPCTTRDRDWPNHILLKGNLEIDRPTYAMTEQVKMISRERFLRPVGLVDTLTLREATAWVNRWLA